MFDDILERKNAFLGNKNKKLKQSKNCHFSNGVNTLFYSEIGHFLNLFFFDNIGKENVFRDILKLTSAFVGNKNKKFKKSKNIFPKGLTHGFARKLVIFPAYFF